MIRALIPATELRLLAQAIGHDVATVKHDGFQVVIDLPGLRLAVLPVEVAVSHPDTSHADVDRIGVAAYSAREPGALDVIEAGLGTITAIDVARTVVRLEPAESVGDAEILGVAVDPGRSVSSTFYHPSEVDAARNGAAALALTDVGVRARTARGRTVWMAVEGFFAVPYMDDHLPPGWEGTIQYLSLDADGLLAT